MSTFSPERLAAVRAQLYAHVADAPKRRQTKLWAATLVLGGAFMGASASAGAFAVSGALTADVGPVSPSAEPSPSLPAPIVAPEGVIPGAPVVSFLAAPVTEDFLGDTEFPLSDRPAGATHVRVTVNLRAAGTMSWGTDPLGNNPTGVWTEADITRGDQAAASYDFPLDDSVTTLFIRASDLPGVVSLQYVRYQPTQLAVNDNGDTFGALTPGAQEPDLVSAVGVDPDGATVDGYVYADDLTAFSPDHPGQPSNPQQTQEWTQERSERYPDGWDIPVYESDGVTQIGLLHMSG